jgi:hypothetical protein
VSKTSQLVRECSPDYSLERIRELEKELDEAHATIRKIFENLQAWLAEHNLAAQSSNPTARVHVWRVVRRIHLSRRVVPRTVVDDAEQDPSVRR